MARRKQYSTSETEELEVVETEAKVEKVAVKARPKKGTPEWEKAEYVQVMLEEIEFDQSTGEKISEPYLYTTNVKHWNLVQLPNLDLLGMTVIEVVNMPFGAKEPEKVGYPKRKTHNY